MVVRLGVEALSKEVANVTKNNKNKITYVCGEEDVVGGVLVDVTWHWLSSGVLRRHAKFFVCAVPKLGVNGGEDLLRRRWPCWKSQAISVVLLLV